MLMPNIYVVALLKSEWGSTAIIPVLSVYAGISEPLVCWIEWFEAAAF